MYLRLESWCEMKRGKKYCCIQKRVIIMCLNKKLWMNADAGTSSAQYALIGDGLRRPSIAAYDRQGYIVSSLPGTMTGSGTLPRRRVHPGLLRQQLFVAAGRIWRSVGRIYVCPTCRCRNLDNPYHGSDSFQIVHIRILLASVFCCPSSSHSISYELRLCRPASR